MPLLLRIIKPLEYRIEDARIESLVTRDRPHSRRIIDGGGEDRPVLFNELKIRKKVVGCDQYQVIKRGITYILLESAVTVLEVRDKLLSRILDTLREQVVDRLVVKVERRTIDTCPPADLFDRYEFQALLLKERHQRVVHFKSCIEVFTLGLIHLPRHTCSVVIPQ